MWVVKWGLNYKTFRECEVEGSFLDPVMVISLHIASHIIGGVASSLMSYSLLLS